MTWDFHVDDLAKGKYDMMLGKDLLIHLVLNLKFSYHVIETNCGPLKGFTEPMVDMGTYECKYLNTGEITPADFFTNAYAE